MRYDKELLTDLLKALPAWGLVPEKFLEFILVAVEMFAHRTGGELLTVETLHEAQRELAAAFLFAFKLELFPYTDFDDLRQKAGPFIDIDRTISRVQDWKQQAAAVWDLCEASVVTPNQETVMEDALEDLRARVVIKKLESYLTFS
ncbi:hypothetical protein [Chitinophaga eiseniae]|nr:hypothetical protein [Chitinophaga eiseniae]